MTEQVMETEKEKIFRQYRDPEDEEKNGKIKFSLFEVARSHYEKVCRGPGIIVSPGQFIELWDPYSIASRFYAGQIIPLRPGIPAIGQYVTRKMFVIIDENGEYQEIQAGTLLKLTREEALDFFKKRRIRPLDENIFYIP
jgi:hypothetical protein